MSETVDIIVKESGSAAAATNVRGIGSAAATTRAQMDQLLLTLNGSNMKLAEIARATGSVEQQMGSLGRSTRVAAEGHKIHNEQMAQGTELAGRAREALVALGLALGIHEWIELTDAYQRNVNGLVQVTTSQENLVAVQKALRQVSMDTFSSLDTNTNLYVRLTKAGKDLNLTQGEMITVIRVLNDGLRLAGNSTDSAGRAISQLSVAMMTGEGSSRAMLSIMRQMPDLTQAIAAKFFTGRDSVVEFKHGVEGGTISIQQVIRAIVSLSSQQDTLARATAQATGATHQAVVATQTEAEAAMIASGRMYDLSKVTGEENKNVIDLSKNINTAAHAMSDIDSKVSHAGHSVSQASNEMQQIGPVAISSFGRAHSAIQQADNSLTKFEQSVKKVEPTIADAWMQMKSALFAYVGESDQASGASEKIAHVLTLAAQNGKVFFGVIGTISAFLVTYTVIAGAAYGATVLFTTAFSRIALAVSIVVGLGVAIYSLGQLIPLTADKSISALGALLAVFDMLKQGMQYVWDLAQQAPGYWGPATLAVGGLVVAMRVLLGVNVITWIVQVSAAMLTLAANTLLAMGPWGLLTAAIIAAALAWAYWQGYLDSALDTLKEKLTPVITSLVDKMKQFTVESQKSGSEAKKFGDVWSGEIARVTNGFESGLLPAMRQTNAALATLKQEAIADMAATKTSVTDVAAALNAVTASAGTASSAVGHIKSGGGRGGDDPKTYTFTTNYYPRMDGLDSAFGRATQISNEDGNPFQNGGPVVEMIKKFGRGGSWDMTMAAEITAALRNMSSSGKGYLKQIFPWIPGLQYGGSFRVGGTGGTDSQLVQFMASPDETVSVQTPQQSANGAGGGKNVTVHMTVLANDAQSFQRTGRQLVTQLESQLSRVAARG